MKRIHRTCRTLVIRSLAAFLAALVLVPVTVHAAEGDLDPTFGDGGLVTTDFPRSGTNDMARDVIAIQPDGKLVVVGGTQAWGGSSFGLARYNTDGILDTTFGGDGRVITSFSYGDDALAVVVQGDGKIIIVGVPRSTTRIQRRIPSSSVATPTAAWTPPLTAMAG